MKVPGLRSDYEKVGGIVFFGRMLDKIRLQAAGRLPSGYNVGTADWSHFDSRCTRFLRVDYELLAKRVLQGGTDEEILDWCFRHVRYGFVLRLLSAGEPIARIRLLPAGSPEPASAPVQFVGLARPVGRCCSR
jgi:hypothetical protein